MNLADGRAAPSVNDSNQIALALTEGFERRRQCPRNAHRGLAVINRLAHNSTIRIILSKRLKPGSFCMRHDQISRANSTAVPWPIEVEQLQWREREGARRGHALRAGSGQ